jgi:hypothetical protein
VRYADDDDDDDDEEDEGFGASPPREPQFRTTSKYYTPYSPEDLEASPTTVEDFNPFGFVNSPGVEFEASEAAFADSLGATPSMPAGAEVDPFGDAPADFSTFVFPAGEPAAESVAVTGGDANDPFGDSQTGAAGVSESDPFGDNKTTDPFGDGSN